MLKWPKTKQEAMLYRYNVWAGNPNGISYNEDKCAAEVWTNERGALPYQCSRNNGKGTNGLYCGIHAKKER